VAVGHGPDSNTMNRTILLILALCGPAAPGSPRRTTPSGVRPHWTRQGPNLVPNPSFSTPVGWTLLGGAVFDPSTSHTAAGSGSVRLRTPIPNGSMAFSDYVSVRSGVQYTFSLYLRTVGGPTYAGLQVALYDAERRFIRNLPSARAGTSADGRWEEAALPFTVPRGGAFVQLQAYKTENTRPGGEVWVDDFYLGEGLGLEQPPARKRGFEGGHVRIDPLGNFEVRKGDRWVPVFPLCIYADNQRDWSVYSRQGWNTVIWTGSADQVLQAREAVSAFNPGGMLAGFQITQYAAPSGWAYKNLKDLSAKLREIQDRKLADNLLLYYWDNENSHEQWDVPAAVIRTLRAADADAAGRPLRPIYALQGEYNIARVHAARGLVDISGTYFGGAAAATGGAGTGDDAGLFFLDRLEGQSSPAVFAQFNGVDGAGDMRLRLYTALLTGARAIGYYRDAFGPENRRAEPAVGPVDEKPWWPDFPNLRREVDRLLPLIRAPHWTTWTARADPSGSVAVGSRDHGGEGYVLLVNRTMRPQTVTIRLEGMPYRPVEARDFFDGRPRARVHAGAFSVALPAIGVGSGTAVLRIAARAISAAQ
jgi:hypothetical protein